jgi:hypothetical protein
VTNEVLERVRPLLPGIAGRAQATDADGAVAEATMKELTAAGALRMLQPARFGGAEGDPVHFYEVVRAISGVCGSTGWVTAVLGVHPWQLALFGERAQEEVWGQDPDTLVSSSYAPAGRLTPVEGGYELTGHWSFSSGCAHASWALLGGLVTGAQGRPADLGDPAGAAAAHPPRPGPGDRTGAAGHRHPVHDRGRQLTEARQPRRAGLARRARGRRPCRQRRRARPGDVRPRRVRPHGRGQPDLIRRAGSSPPCSGRPSRPGSPGRPRRCGRGRRGAGRRPSPSRRASPSGPRPG